MSVVSQVILLTTMSFCYPSTGELSKNFATGEQRMRIAAALAENEKRLFNKPVNSFGKKRPDFISPGGNAYGERQRALCPRDYGWYLRLITTVLSR